MQCARSSVKINPERAQRRPSSDTSYMQYTDIQRERTRLHRQSTALGWRSLPWKGRPSTHIALSRRSRTECGARRAGDRRRVCNRNHVGRTQVRRVESWPYSSCRPRERCTTRDNASVMSVTGSITARHIVIQRVRRQTDASNLGRSNSKSCACEAGGRARYRGGDTAVAARDQTTTHLPTAP